MSIQQLRQVSGDSAPCKLYISSRVVSLAFPKTTHLTSRILIHLVVRVRIGWDGLDHWRSTLKERENP